MIGSGCLFKARTDLIMTYKYNLFPVFLVALTSSASAVLETEMNQASGAAGTDAIDSFTPSSTDLAQSGSSTLLSSTVTVPDNFNEPPTNLGNGDLSATNNGTRGLFFSQSFNGGQLPSTLTITLDTSVNSQGYDINGITTYAGWDSNGSALANQQYLLEYSVVGDAGFISLGVQSHAPFDNSDPNAAGATELILTSPSGLIASGVDAVRLTFQDHGFTNVSDDIDGTVYQEIDIFGTAVEVPGGPVGLNVTRNQASGAAGTDAIDSFTPSSTDLAQSGSSTLLSSTVTVPDNFNEPPTNLGNGDLSATNNGTRGLFFSQSFNGGQLPSTLTITLDTSVNSQGYDINGITTYAGWDSNGSALANQQYLLEYSVVGDAGFISLGVQSHAPFDNSDPNAAGATELILTSPSGLIASGVDAVRLTFQDHGFTNVSDDIDGTVYQEIDIFGTAVEVPGGPIPIGDIWFIGDSITQSNADGDPNDSPRRALYEMLTQNNYEFTFTGHFADNVDGLPVTGSTPETNLFHFHSGISGSVIGDNVGNRVGMTQNIDSGQNFWNSGRLDTVKPEIILIMLGTNDVEQNIDLATAPARIETLIDTIMAQPGVGEPAFFVAQIPPNLRAGSTERVVAFNAALPDIVDGQRSLGRDVTLVDPFTPLNANTDAFIRADDLHTNTAGNAVIAQQWFDGIVARFSPTEPLSIAAWQIDNFGSIDAPGAGLEEDPDNDGNNNLYEFAFGLDPLAVDGGGEIAFDGQTFSYTARNPEGAGLVYFWEQTETLLPDSWVEVLGVTSLVTDTDGDFESVEITDPSGDLFAPVRNFFRLVVEEATLAN